MGKTSRILLACTFLVVIAAIGTSVFLFLQTRHTTPLTKTQSRVGFTLFYPKPAPEGYQPVKNSVSVSGETVIAQLSNGADTVTVTQQPKPRNADELKIDGFTNVTTSIGTMALGTAEDRSTGIITSAQSIITISANNKAAVTAIAQALKPVSTDAH